MSELQTIEAALRRVAWRLRCVRTWRAFWWGLLVGGLIWLAAFGTYKLMPLPVEALWGAAGAAGLTLLAFLASGFWPKPSLLTAARWVDQRMKLKERLSTALELASGSGPEEWRRLVVHDAVEHIRDFEARGLVHYRLPRVARWAMVVVVAGAGLGFVPEYRSQAYVQRQRESKQVRQVARKLLEVTRKQLDQRPPVLKPTRESLQDVQKTALRLSEAKLSRTDALRDLTEAMRRLQQQLDEFERDAALRRMEQAARKGEGVGAQDQQALQQKIDELQKALNKAADNPAQLDKLKQDLLKAKRELEELKAKDPELAKQAQAQLAQALEQAANAMNQLGRMPEGLQAAIEALKAGKFDQALQGLDHALVDLDKLRDMAQALQQLKQGLAQLGKDLPEQLERNQIGAAHARLLGMIRKLKSGTLSEEELRKILDEVKRAVAPARGLGQTDKFLAEAAKALAQGQTQQGAKALGQAADELKKLLDRLNDAQCLMASIDALEKAQRAIAQKKSWEDLQGLCQACQGAGCTLCKGKGWRHGGGTGAGVGTWADELEGWVQVQRTDQVIDNSDVIRPDMDPRGQTDRPVTLREDMAPTKVKGKYGKGGPMPSVSLPGVSIKGQSRVKYEEVSGVGSGAEQRALSEDKVPRAYRDLVHEYFKNLDQ